MPTPFTTKLYFSIFEQAFFNEEPMTLKNLFVIAIATLAITACGGNDNAPTTEPAPVPSSGVLNPPSEFCFFTNLEPQGGVEYTVLRNVKAAKGSYGSVTYVVPLLKENTIVRGGNAVIHYAASQRFGFWPWRIVRPVARGRAINITNAKGLSCKEMGGYTESDILSGTYSR